MDIGDIDGFSLVEQNVPQNKAARHTADNKEEL